MTNKIEVDVSILVCEFFPPKPYLNDNSGKLDANVTKIIIS